MRGSGARCLQVREEESRVRLPTLGRMRCPVPQEPILAGALLAKDMKDCSVEQLGLRRLAVS